MSAYIAPGPAVADIYPVGGGWFRVEAHFETRTVHYTRWVFGSDRATRTGWRLIRKLERIDRKQNRPVRTIR